MIESTSSTAPNPAQSVANAASSKSAEKPVLSSDFETFLKMLTAQMRNQDPLNPVESADFAVQLAAFSTVEQQVRTNDLLESLGARVGALGMSQLAGWVGMEARAATPVKFDGAPLTLTLRADPLADSAQIVVRDTGGNVVQRLDAAAETGPVLWAGVGDTGAPLPAGRYDIALESYRAGDLLGARAAELHGRIVEARNDGDRITLVFAGGEEVPSGEILGLRAPEG